MIVLRLNHFVLWFLNVISIWLILLLLLAITLDFTLLISHSKVSTLLLLLLICVKIHRTCCWCLTWRSFNYLLLALWLRLYLLVRNGRLRLFAWWSSLHYELLLLLLVCSLGTSWIPAWTAWLLGSLHLVLPLHVTASSPTLSRLMRRLLLELLLVASAWISPLRRCWLWLTSTLLSNAVICWLGLSLLHQRRGRWYYSGLASSYDSIRLRLASYRSTSIWAFILEYTHDLLLLLIWHVRVLKLLLLHDLSLSCTLINELDIGLSCSTTKCDIALRRLLSLTTHSKSNSCSSRLRLSLYDLSASILGRSICSIALLFFLDHILVIIIVISTVVVLDIDILSPFFFLFIRVLLLRFPTGFDDSACWDRWICIIIHNLLRRKHWLLRVAFWWEHFSLWVLC